MSVISTSSFTTGAFRSMHKGEFSSGVFNIRALSTGTLNIGASNFGVFIVGALSTGAFRTMLKTVINLALGHLVLGH